MSKLSEAAQVELLKMATELTRQYVSDVKNIGHAELKRIGFNKDVPSETSLFDVIDHFYTHLCAQIKP